MNVLDRLEALRPDEGPSIRDHDSIESGAMHERRPEPSGDDFLALLPEVLGFRVLGDCLLQEFVGQGGMGVVYRGFSRNLHRPVAVKILRVGRGATGDEISRFKREVELTASVNSENLVRIFYPGNDEGLPYQVLEWLDGDSLTGILQAHVRLDCSVAVAIMRWATRGVVAAHQHGIIHRDIKPSNVMVTTGGDVKLLDLGIAKPAPRQGVQSLTDMGAALGTPGFMAPEQWTSAKSVDFRSDVYSLGATLYSLLTGVPGIQGDDPKEIMHRTLNFDFPRVRDLRPEIPQAVDEIVARATRRNAEERFQTTMELAHALASLDFDEPELAGMVGTPIAVEEITPTPEILEEIRLELENDSRGESDEEPVLSPGPKRFLIGAILVLIVGLGAYFTIDSLVRSHPSPDREEDGNGGGQDRRTNGDESPTKLDSSKSDETERSQDVDEKTQKASWERALEETRWPEAVSYLEAGVADGIVELKVARAAILDAIGSLKDLYDVPAELEVLALMGTSNLEPAFWKEELANRLYQIANDEWRDGQFLSALAFAESSTSLGHDRSSKLSRQSRDELKAAYRVEMKGLQERIEGLSWTGQVAVSPEVDEVVQIEFGEATTSTVHQVDFHAEKEQLVLKANFERDGFYEMVLKLERAIPWPDEIPESLRSAMSLSPFTSTHEFSIRIDTTPPSLSINCPKFVNLLPGEDMALAKMGFQFSEQDCSVEIEGFETLSFEEDEPGWQKMCSYGIHNFRLTPIDAAANRGATQPLTVKVGLADILFPRGSLSWHKNAAWIRLENWDSKPLVFIEQGEFEFRGEKVEVQPFFISPYEVSASQYLRFLRDTERHVPAFPVYQRPEFAERPSVYVNYHEAVEYCRWLTKELKADIPEGFRFRLATEMQWEYVARQSGRIRALSYPWGDEKDPTEGSEAKANGNGFLSLVKMREKTAGLTFTEKQQFLEERRGKDGAIKAMDVENNGFGFAHRGILHLAGNVAEWCRPGKGDSEVMGRPPTRGGSWDSPTEFMRCSKSVSFDPGERSESIGFRVVLEKIREARRGERP